MAGDWIKIEHTTPDKPEVICMAQRLKIDPDSVVGKLIRVWVWADQNSVDGNGVTVTDAFLDRLAHRKGFAKAMRGCGWLDGKDGGLIFPGFFRHNGTTAKARAAGNRRVVKHRNCNATVTVEALQKTLPEKRREEKNTPTECSPLPPKGDVHFSDDLKFDPVGIVHAYPRREGDKEALEAVALSIRKGADPAAILAGTRAIAAVIPSLPSGHLNSFVVSAAKFFRAERWRDDPATWRRAGGKNGAMPGTLNLGGRRAVPIES
jgi:hypothetical protein